MDYESLLNKAYEKLPNTARTGERFVMPVAEVVIQGNQTTIKNFSQICEAIGRDPRHLLKYLTKELATPANFDGSRANLQAKVMHGLVQKKLETYVKEYVICKECSRPDTKLMKDDRITFLKCEACGAKISVKAVK